MPSLNFIHLTNQILRNKKFVKMFWNPNLLSFIISLDKHKFHKFPINKSYPFNVVLKIVNH